MLNARTKSPDRSEDELLAAARGGEEAALRHLVEAHRTDLHAHCYRMLGSHHDADDAVQDALLRAWRALPRFEGRSAFRTWLHRIATNTCLDVIELRRNRVQPIGGGHDVDASELVAGSPVSGYERREAVQLALIAALQHLPPRQRAALILREVLGFSARESALALGTTVASVNSALQRARRTIDQRLLRQSQLATLRLSRDKGMRQAVERLVTAFEGMDVDGILSLLGEDIAAGYGRTRGHHRPARSPDVWARGERGRSGDRRLERGKADRHRRCDGRPVEGKVRDDRRPRE